MRPEADLSAAAVGVETCEERQTFSLKVINAN